MFKFFAIVFAAILAIAVAAPKPGGFSTPVIAAAPLAYSTYSAPLTYSTGYQTYSAPLATPLNYPAYGAYAYSAPLIHY